MSTAHTVAKAPPLFTPIGLLLLVVFFLAMLAAGLSTQGFIKRLDGPPAGTYQVISGEKNALFVKLAQKSIKGLHHAIGLRGQLEVPGEPATRPLLVRSRNSTEWEKKMKIPQLTPGAKPVDIESNIAVLLDTTIPDAPKLYGRIIPASFDLDMVVPRLDPNNPKVGVAMPDRVTWTMQLQLQPPGFLRIYQRINRLSLIVAGAVVALALIRQLFRRMKSAR
jgi:hypothetical protein